MGEGHQFVVDLGADATRTNLRMDAERKIECGGAFGQGEQITVRRKDIDLLGVEVELEFVNELQRVFFAAFQHFPYLREPIVQVVRSVAPFVLVVGVLITPVRGQSLFGNLVHASRPDLNFHPFARRRHHGGVQALVTISFWKADPIAQTVGVGLVKVRDDAVGAPGVGLFRFVGRIEDDANGKNIVDLFEGHPLLLHLAPDAVNALRPAFYLALNPRFFQGAANGQGKRIDEPGAHGFSLAQFGGDCLVILRFFVFQRQVFQLRFDAVQAQAVGQRCIHEQGFARNLLLLVRTHVLERPHVVQAVGELDQNHAHIIAQGQQHFAEVLRLSAGPRIEHARHLGQTVHNFPFALAKQLLYVFQGQIRVLDGVVQQGTDDGRGIQAQFLCHDPRDADRMVDVRLTALAPHVLVGFQCNVEGFSDGPTIGGRLAVRRRTQQPPVAPEDFLLFSFEVNGRGRHVANFGQFFGKSTLPIAVTCGHV